ncbi:MAG: SpoIIE family protein phosphatase [Filomicrobium sp.]
MLAFEHGRRATRGAREYQEDTATVQTIAPADGAGSDLIAVLADGMGGHIGGALASKTICDQFVSAFQAANGSVSGRLQASLGAANDSLAKKVAADPMLSGMGSTVIGTAFTGAGLEWVSVGDSPLYLFRRGEMAVLNEDHSLAPELDRMAAAGQISLEQAKQDPRRHMLRSAVTGEELDLVDSSKKALVLEPDDVVILASDGLNTLDDDEIERVIKGYCDDGSDAIASALIRAVEACREPHQDNATVVAIKVASA